MQVLCKAYLILSDDNKRAVYDDTGCVDDEDEVIQDDRDWNEYWRLLFPKVTTEVRYTLLNTMLYLARQIHDDSQYKNMAFRMYEFH